ncbi:MAG: TlyA family RNA methyltransferase [Oligoflexia bacterium]|nr:TlyA family RNA methyltransferase [Oligoflexia bacterium]
MGSEKEKKERADKLLTDQGLARSRTQAQALIMAGVVCLGDQLIKKASELFPIDTKFRIKEGAVPKYVSRGGEKMEGALENAGLNVKDFRVLDVGISTGGFSDCLLQKGAQSILGLDVGKNQLDWKLRNDPRVTAYEGINARALPEGLVEGLIGGGFDLVVIDVSFISLTLVLPQTIKYMKPQGYMLVLIKPQFEVDKAQVGKGGIVKDPLLHQQVQEKIKKLSESLGLVDFKIFESPIEGTDGNKEFFIFARHP